MTKSAAIVLAALLCVWCAGAVGQAPTASTPAATTQAPAPIPTPASQTKRESLVYKVVEIPYLSPTAADDTIASCSVAAVNNHGIAVGSCDQNCSDCGGAPAIPSVRAWMYEEKSAALDELTFEPGEHRAAATDISNSDIISGYIVGTPVSFGAQPVFWTASGGAVLLGQDDDDTVATGVNAGGAIVGTYTEPSEPSTQALMWSPPDYAQITLQGLPCDHCFTLFANSVNAINNRGIAVGQSLGNDGALAVEWQSGTVTSLGSLDNSGGSDAYAINNKGDVVGDSSTTQPMQPQHAFLYHQGVMTDLGTLAGDAASTARSINKEGQIVGTSFNSVNSGRAFLYQNGQMYDLNSLIKPTSPLTGLVKFAGAVSISSRGWIAVNGIDTRDQLTHAFLLIPAR